MKQKKYLFLIFILESLLPFTAFSQDSVNSSPPQFIALKLSQGSVLPTNDFISGKNKIPHYTSIALKYGFSSKGDKWQDYSYGLPYMGVGLYIANLHRADNLGTPVSLFFFQGGTLMTFNPKLGLNYEWNAGAAFNWKTYNPFTNPDNIAIGSGVNIHASVNLYMKWKLSNKVHLDVGAEFDHFSNAAFRLPNRGVNLISGSAAISYHFNSENWKYHPELFSKPEIEKTREHDIMVLLTARNVEIDTVGTNLPDKYIRQNFIVLGGSYAYMFNDNYRYRWGPSVEVTYDESANTKYWREENNLNGRMYDRIQLGNFFDRFSVGLSMKGEIYVYRFSGFLNVGYDIIHARKEDGKFYQIFGVKVFLKENLFGVFGVRTMNFGKSQYMFLNLGYTIK